MCLPACLPAAAPLLRPPQVGILVSHHSRRPPSLLVLEDYGNLHRPLPWPVCVRFRIKYPNVVAGAIAASAPIWDFEGDSEAPATYSFYRIVTQDASEEGGSSPNCAVGCHSCRGPQQWKAGSSRVVCSR